jgi:hypothetical protein
MSGLEVSSGRRETNMTNDPSTLPSTVMDQGFPVRRKQETARLVDGAPYLQTFWGSVSLDMAQIHESISPTRITIISAAVEIALSAWGLFPKRIKATGLV